MMGNVTKFGVFLINTYPTSTGIGEYVYDLLNINNTTCLSLIFKKWAGSTLKYPGQKYTSFFPELNDKMEFIFNAYMQRIAYPNLKRIVNKTNSQIIHYTDPSIMPLKTNKISTVTIHDLLAFYPTLTDGGFLNMRFRYIIKNLEKYKHFGNVIAISNRVKNELIEEGWQNEISVIPYPISDVFRFLNRKKYARERLGLPQDKYLILSVSTNTPRKNLTTVKNVIKLLGEDFILVRVGPKVGNSITFDYVDNRETMNLIYNACDVLLFPTIDEGFGRPVVEAMAAGLPCVLSDIEIMREIAGSAAIFVPNNDVQLYKESVYSLMGNDKMREKGIVQAANFSLDIFRGRMIKFYEKLIR